MWANVGAMARLGGWILFIATLYMQQVRGWSALQTAFAVFPAGLLSHAAAYAPCSCPSA